MTTNETNVAEDRVKIRQISPRKWMVSECGQDVYCGSRKSAYRMYCGIMDKHRAKDRRVEASGAVSEALKSRKN